MAGSAPATAPGTRAEESTTTRTHAICRYCAVSCGVLMDIEDGRLVSLIGDKDNPAYHGFTCKKGRELPAHLYHPNRLLVPLRRRFESGQSVDSAGEADRAERDDKGTGNFERISREGAISEIAQRLSTIIDEHGPASVAFYSGTYALGPPVSMLASAFMQGLGSPMSFGCGSIDQPGKFIATALHGRWRGGSQPFAAAETWLFVGTNPVVSKLGGLPTINPGWHLHRAMKRGIKLIVIDPRRSETAKKARIHLQPVPGEDAAVLAGMIRVVLEEGLFDKAFVEENTRNLEILRQHVEPFTPELVAQRADIPARELIEAARVFAGAATGGANAGTGINMSPRGTLTEYLLSCLVSLCGFGLREGDPDPNPGVLVPRGPRRAQPSAPTPGWGFPPKLRVRGLTNTACGLPTGALADEMLLEGEGQIHALICMGGNPMTAWPDQIKTRKALEGLDLLVVGDPKLTQTAQLADFVIAPKLVPEIPALTYDMEVLEGLAPGWGYPQPYAAYREALIDPPAGSELFEDWEFLYLLGRELELELTVYTGTTRFEGDPKARPVPLDMHNTPTTDDLFEILTADARVPLSVVRQYEAGSDFEVPDAVVLGREPECEGFLEFGNVVMMNQLDDAAEDAFAGDGEFAFRLVSRRQANTMNSQGRDQDKLVRERPHNPAYMNPMDLDALGVVSGAMVAITSRRSTIHAIAVASPDLRRGVISMSHSYGIDLDSLDPNAEPGAPQPYSMGGHTGALASADLDYVEQYSGIPRMSSIPVHVKSV